MKTHSSWLTEDDQFLLVCNELDGIPARIFDVSDLNNIEEVNRYSANLQSLVHNPYIRGDYAFISHNTEGLRVVDLYDPRVPVEVGFYDTYTGESGGFRGLWSACPYFPSGKVIGGNREDGLYVWTFNNAKAGRMYTTVVDDASGFTLSGVEMIVLEEQDSLRTDNGGQVGWGALPGTYTLSFTYSRL